MDIQSLATNSAFTGALARPPGAQTPSPGRVSQGSGTQELPADVAPGAAGEAGSREQLDAAVKAAQDFVGAINSSLEFSVDDDTGTPVVRIVDRETRELIRQMPSEEMLSIAKALDTIKGLLLRQEA